LPANFPFRGDRRHDKLPSMATKTIPPSEALTHVLYEMRMMIEARRLMAGVQPETPQYNLFLEGFLIHARCLFEFFSESKDGIKPSEFGISNIPPLCTKEPLYKRMHREIAHLAHERHINVSEKSWDLSAVWLLLQPACVRFLEEIENRKDQYSPTAITGLTALAKDFTSSETELFKLGSQTQDQLLSSSSDAVLTMTSYTPGLKRCEATSSIEEISEIL
jgi:hypothetical protein